MSILQDHKFQASLTSALIFLVVSQPKVYGITNGYLGVNSLCPTLNSRLLHVVVFFILSLAVRHWFNNQPFDLIHAKYAFYGALIFFFLSSPEVYNFADKLFGLDIDVNCPSQEGIVLQSAVFLGVLYVLMHIHDDKEHMGNWFSDMASKIVYPLGQPKPATPEIAPTA